MSDANPSGIETPDSDVETERPALASLFVELTRDAGSFARAEIDYLKAKAGLRAHRAAPGFGMIGIAIALALGILMAVPVGLLLLLAPMIGTGWALLAVTLGGVVLAALLFKLGTRRIKTVLKRSGDE